MVNWYTNRSKFNNHKVTRDGVEFDSILESKRYEQLKVMQDCGVISDLKVHPKILLQPSFKHNGQTIRKIEYEADFGYAMDGKLILEDVKGFETDVFKLKWKWATYLGYDIRVLYKEDIEGNEQYRRKGKTNYQRASIKKAKGKNTKGSRSPK